MIGLLTETIGNPTPIDDPVHASEAAAGLEPALSRSRRRSWHFRQSIDYSITANCAVLDIASRNRENFLFNIYRMGKNSIERGNRDSWTPTPRRVIAVQTAAGGRGQRRAERRRGGRVAGGGRGAGGSSELFKTMLRDPANRDPRGFILPSDQPDFPTATEVRQRADQGRRERAPRDRGVHGRRQELSRRARTS